jgi:glycosyltransferase involved in cell wall biosynthesis
MVKIGFWFDAPVEYSGGLNYIKNLLYALSLVNDGSVSAYVFFSAGIPESVEAEFVPYATVVRTEILQRRTLPWFIHRVLYRSIGWNLLATAQLKSYGIDVLSHVWFEYRGRVPFRIIGWLLDFQYLHLPELFPTIDMTEETRTNQKIIKQSDVVIVSSNDALQDFKRIAPPGYESRAQVMQFVSQPRTVRGDRSATREELERTYAFHGHFFFLPNQFWTHKNHMVVWEAVKLLKNRGIDILVLCTGNTRDYRVRDTTYFDGLLAYLEVNGLQDNVRVLGMIDYEDVLAMMKASVAVINPSRFEGWSSTVEEAKSIGKRVILSRIGVHVEQDPPGGRFFDPDDARGLSDILADTWAARDDASSARIAETARAALHERTLAYGTAYLDLVRRVASGSMR